MQKNQMLNPNQIAELEHAIEIKDFRKIYNAYNDCLRSEREMDYDDQMVYAHRILCNCPEILDYFQSRFKYLCVDEAQDTSKIQHEIISILAKKHNNLFMVGDEDQSIYGFRAAYPKALLQFNGRYPNGQTLLLEQNYRSAAPIIDAANKFVSVNRNRIKKTIIPTRGTGEPVKNIRVQERQDQYAVLLNVAENCTRETAVLYRDNDSAIPLIDMLERKNLPYITKQMESSFFTHRTVKDIIDVISLYYDPYNWQAFLSIYYKFDMPIKKAQLQSVAATNKRSTVFEALSRSKAISQSQKDKVTQFFRLLSNIAREKNGEAVIDHIMGIMNYKQYLKRMKMDSGKVEILKFIGKHEKDGKDLLARLNKLNEIISSPPKYPDAKFILSTIHSSKGLEYDRVYMMDIIDGVFPKEDRGLTGDDEEERRLFYVGITRAKNELLIFTFKNRNGTYASFSAEIFPDLVNHETQKHMAANRFITSPHAVQPTHTMAKHESMQQQRTYPKNKLSYADIKSLRAELAQYHQNTRVTHTHFGCGIVKSISTDRNGNKIAMIQFEAYATAKKIDLATAIISGVLFKSPTD